MSMLSTQCEGLREAANILDEIGISMGYDTTASAFIAHDVSERMREAAYTIESLRKQLAKNSIAELRADYDTSRYGELFGTPERAARTLIAVRDKCESGPCSPICPFGHAPVCPSNFESSDYDALLEWLRGDAE